MNPESGDGVQSYSAWNSWNPAEYLRDYFDSLKPDEEATLQFLVSRLKIISNDYKIANVPILDFGSGPLVIHGIAAIPYSNEIHFADYLQQNIFEIKKWLEKSTNAFNWKKFTYYILKLEGNVNPSDADVVEREEAVRNAVIELHYCNADHFPPITTNNMAKYKILISTFCSESATSDRATWQKYLRNIINMVDTGGHLLLASLKGADYYRVGKERFPCTSIDEKDIIEVLKSENYSMEDLYIHTVDLPQCRDLGYNSAIFIHAHK